MARSRHVVLGLYQRYGNEIRSQIAGKLSCREDVEDLSQEVFLRAHRILRSQVINQPRAYLHRIASSVVTDHFRQRLRRSAPPLVMEPWDEDLEIAAREPTPEEIAIGDETLRALEVAVESLPAKARQAVVLRMTEDLSYIEVAQRMGISVKTVEKHLARAMADLRASVNMGLLDRRSCRR